jgi:hypothetical protein
MRRVIALLIAVIAVPATAGLPWSGDKVPHVSYTTKHEALVKTPLQQIAFAEPVGKCADLLADSLLADFAMSGVTVIDRNNLQRILAEHKFNITGAIDEKTAARIGKLIGAGSLVFIKVHDCTTSKVKELRNAVHGLGVKRTLVPTTRASMKASIQIVNLTTGVTSAARVVDARASLSADEMDKSRAGKIKDAAISVLTGAKEYSEFPAEEDVLTLLLGNAVEQVHRLLFAWEEKRQFAFFNDVECSLNLAYDLLQAGDLDGAAREAQGSLDTCMASGTVKPATLARAHYNRGMTYFVGADYANALVHLSQAARLNDNKVFAEALAACNRARVELLAGGPSPSHPPVKTTASNAAAPGSPGTATPTSKETKLSPEERLRRLDELHKKKLISDAEYEKKRKEILAEL